MKNRVRILIRFGLLGLFLNVICCWFLVGVVDFPERDAQWIMGKDLRESRAMTVHQSRGGMMITASINNAGQTLSVLTLDDPRVPSWSRLRTFDAYEKGMPIPKRFDIAYGWPMLSLSLSYDNYFSPIHGAFIGETMSGAVPYLEFPISIIAPGFIVNTLLFSIAGWIVVSLLHRVQVAFRLRTGRCPDCALPLPKFANSCEQCGWNVAENKPAVSLPKAG